ncbi:MAG TPA: acylphosphatase [Thermodesulfobacteriota bacterium]|nr:acylphosphatase [Thermodesulfobacteriota bacterium]
MGKERVTAIIHGRVHGVFYRASAREKAIELGLTGWVRNRLDKTVEVVAEGDKKQLDNLIEWCRVGPPDAYVTEVEVKWEPYNGEFKGFSVKYREH